MNKGWIDPHPRPLAEYQKQIEKISRGIPCRGCGRRFHNMNSVLCMKFCLACMTKLDDLAEEFGVTREEMAEQFMEVYGGPK